MVGSLVRIWRVVRPFSEVCDAIEIRMGSQVRGQRWWTLVLGSGVICPRRAIHSARRAKPFWSVGNRKKDGDEDEDEKNIQMATPG
jgi:hypothetical protein